MGVFATRSPFRPNPIGLSCVKLEKITSDDKYGDIIIVSGVDIMDKTPIYDIKPYLPYVDSHPEASDGFALAQKEGTLTVDISDEIKRVVPSDKLQGLIDTLSQDPRPQYQNSPDRVYTMSYAGLDVSFTIDDKTLTVLRIKPI